MYDKLKQLFLRLKMLANASEPALYGFELSSDVFRIQEILSRLASGMVEAVQAIETFCDLQPTTPLSRVFLEAVKEVSTSTNVLRDQLFLVVDKMKMSAFPIILHGGQCRLVSMSQRV